MVRLQCVGVLAHPYRPKTVPIAEKIALSLRRHGIDTWVHNTWDGKDVLDDVRCANMLVAIGGDGAMLKAARISAPYEIPVLGVNMGRLGFLTEIAHPEDWEDAMNRVLSGKYWIETRMMIRSQIKQGDTISYEGDALNDVLISGDGVGHMIQLDLFIDGDWTTTYNADSLIISTPTGSTAYALAIGGPILPPDLKNILIVPSAPHLSLRRAIVLSQGSDVKICMSNNSRYDVVVIIDGIRLGTVGKEGAVHVTGSDYKSRFVRLRDRNYFYRSLLDRLEPRVRRRFYEEDDYHPPSTSGASIVEDV